MLPPAQYMSDIQFIFKKQQIEGDKKQIYIRVAGSDTITTYMIVFQARHSKNAHEI